MTKKDTPGLQHICKGNTSLSRFSTYFHECYLIGRQAFICKNFIEELNKELLRVTELNNNIRVESGEKEIENEGDIIPEFQRVVYIKHIAFTPNLPVCNAILLSEECVIDSMENIELLKFLVELNDYISIHFNSEFNEINVELKNPKKSIPSEMKRMIYFWGRSLIRDRVNTHANIYHLFDIDENLFYQYSEVSHSLLQSIYLEIAKVLTKYHVSRCRYHLCDELIISLNTRSKQCCCDEHQTCYRRKIKNSTT